MPSNIEIKAKLHNGIGPAEVIAKSLAEDQKIHQHLQQIDTFFNSPNGRLKLRQENDRAVLIAYQRSDAKGPKLSDYVLSPVPDPVTMEDALRRSNGIKGRVEKDRKVYLVEGRNLITRVHLDNVKGLGEFIEFEVIITKDEDLSQGKEMAEELMAKFDIKPEDLINCAYMDQLLEQK